ncbi:MAG: Water stress and hypersensitive response domain-containing protein [Aquabacterium sp.]|uniref:LEA type 2 family protein n=1 Tax=Aquabacterium sp. TaxID=1872578 RepID=UPI001215F50D|nr:LEA type 2 family protein [Aquabacterium sp.]TAK97712.1 MAG: Water stress and hypersensitive response domain-containing protein [Aquabacterium sp.]
MFNPARRTCLRALALSASGLALTGCANLLDRESVRVTVVGLDPLPGELMEARLALKLRVQNPTESTVDYDGISVELDLRGNSFASGVSSEKGSIPRFGEALIAVPVSVSAFAVLRQVAGLAAGSGINANTRIEYALRGRLAGSGLGGGTRFAANGELELPKGLIPR